MEIGVVGAGIVGLALARTLLERDPSCRVTVLEKERLIGRHQTSHNSGVVHAGLYYQPGSIKAALCVRGRTMLREYCLANDVAYRECGKLVVAVDDDELAGLRAIHDRAQRNGVPDVRWLSGADIRCLEPHARGVAAVHSPRTAVVDFAEVAAAMAREVEIKGGAIRTSSAVRAVRRRSGRVEVLAGEMRHSFDRLVVCAGLQSDRVSRLAGGPRDPQIVPFLGMYYRLLPQRRDLVRSLVYPVPDSRYPFLGIHLTRTVHDDVLVGPNAVLGLAREGYRPTRVSLRDTVDTVGSMTFLALARRNWRAGLKELNYAVNRRAFVAAARRYVPDLTDRDIERAGTGVRAQAVSSSGALVDDFALADSGGVLSVRNAPSPAATSSLAIAEYLAPMVVGAG